MRVLALDVGSSSLRARAFDERARELEGAARRAYEPRHGRDGSAELDAEELVLATRAVLEEARQGAHDALAISCFWHSLLLLDAGGRPLTPVLLVALVVLALTFRMIAAYFHVVLGLDLRAARRRAILHQAVTWILLLGAEALAVALLPRVVQWIG